MQRASNKGGRFSRTRVLTGAAAQGLQRLAPDFDASEHLGELTEMIDKIDGRLAAVDANDDLSDSGKRRRRQQAINEAVQELEAWESQRVGGLIGHASSLRSSHAAEQKPVDPIEALRAEIRHGEIRAQFRDIDETELAMLWPNLDAETRQAIESAPLRLSRDKQKVLVQKPWIAAEVAAKHRGPEADPRLRQAEQIDALRDHLQRLVVSAERELGVRDDQAAYRVSENAKGGETL